jgi:hypothetical protein
MFNSEYLQEKWAPVIGHHDLPEIKDPYRRAVTSVLLENQEKFLREERNILNETAPVSSTASTSGYAGLSGGAPAGGPTAGFDPVLISLIRRSMPNLVAYDICGVQPMSGPTGLIFAMRSRYTNQSGNEALFNEADTSFASQNTGGTLNNAALGTGASGFPGSGSSTQTGNNPSVLNDTPAGTYDVYSGMTTAASEALGDSAGNAFQQLAFSIEKVTVTAKTRALKAEYSLELAQDLKAIHGLDAETELANILSSEILAEINREIVRTVYNVAEVGAQANVANKGIFNLDTDSNGRWSVEKFKGLLYQIERDANAIAQRTRRGKGNFIVCSADVASALAMAGVLDYNSGLTGPNGNSLGQVDDTGNTYIGTINGRIKVYIDPYSANVSPNHYYVVGYKGTSPYDAGIFYCPYVPLQMVRAVGQDNFQPKIGFKTRYGVVSNPFAEFTPYGQAPVQGLGRIQANTNTYYRRVEIQNLM